MNTELSNKYVEFKARASKLVSDSVKLPRAYDNNIFVLKSALPFIGDNVDILTNAKIRKACDNLESLLSDLENNRPVSVVYSGEVQKSDEQIVKYAQRHSRIMLEKHLLQMDYERRMSAYNEKLTRIEKLVANDRPAFVNALGMINSVDIENYEPVSDSE